MHSEFYRGMNFKSRGLGFAEVLFSIGIVSVVIVTIVGTLSSGLEALQKATAYNQAMIIGQRTIEYYKSMSYAFIPIHDPDPEVTKTSDGFIIEVTVIEATYPVSPPVTPAMKYKKVTVVVSKAEGVGSDVKLENRRKKSSITLETIIIEN